MNCMIFDMNCMTSRTLRIKIRYFYVYQVQRAFK